ncbi:MAG TPA: hypothetical protein VH496_19920 [Mycobacterium sp.]|jgi:hypothetical protein
MKEAQNMVTPVTQQTPQRPLARAAANHLALAVIVAAWVFVLLSGYLVSLLV